MSPQPEEPLARQTGCSANPPEYSVEERKLLLQLAHDAIAAQLEGRQISLLSPTSHLAEFRGVFTSLYADGTLRGCVGYPLAITPLYQAVAETARAAAFSDPRFHPLAASELPGLEVSLSVLSALAPIRPEDVEIGLHGLVIGAEGRRGLLLPQVPVEHHWDRITFLEQTCKKAGLPVDAWQSGAKIEAFTAEVFGDGASL